MFGLTLAIFSKVGFLPDFIFITKGDTFAIFFRVGTGPDFIFSTKGDTSVLLVIGSPAVSGKSRYGVGSVVTIGYHSAGNPRALPPLLRHHLRRGPGPSRVHTDAPVSMLTGVGVASLRRCSRDLKIRGKSDPNRSLPSARRRAPHQFGRANFLELLLLLPRRGPGSRRLSMVSAQRRMAVPKSVVQLQRRIRIKCEAQGRRALESAATVLERHFNAYAAHGSGLLSRIEFVKLMREGLEMKPPHYEIAAIMKLYPGPGEHSGRLDQSSFIRDVLQQQKPKGARQIVATARSDNASTVISTERSAQSQAAFGFGFGGGFGTHHTAGDGQAPSGNVRVALTRPVKAFFRRVIEIARSTGPGTLKAQCMRVFIKM